MILFTRDLLFVHNPKTAGTSLLHLLAAILPGPVHHAGVAEVGTYHPHLSPSMDYASRVSQFNPTHSQILSVLRAPIDRELSMYLYYRNILATSPTLHVDLPDVQMRRAVDQAARLDLVDWLGWQESEFGHCDLWRSERYYRADNGDVPRGLNILRFDQLEEDLVLALSKLQLPHFDLPQLNQTDRNGVDLSLPTGVREFVEHSYKWMAELPHSAFACGRNQLRRP